VAALAAAPASATFPGRNEVIAYSSCRTGATGACEPGTAGVWTIDPATVRRHRILTGIATDLAWSPDGGQVAYVRRRHRQIYVANEDGSDQRRITSGSHPAFSADGKRIAFTRHEGGSEFVYSTRVDGRGKPKRLATAARDPVYSPNGKWIAYTAQGSCAGKRVGTCRHLGLMRPDGSDQRDVAASFQVTDWSPDGSQLLSITRGGAPVEVINPDGSGRHSLGLPNNYVYSIGYSPDGRFVVYDSSERRELAVYDLRDGSVTELPVTHRFALAWRPRP
jgi:Tol biopolymer transport system component